MNKKDLITDLMLLGLTEKEAKLYYHALQLKSFSVSEISIASGLKRPTCYLVIESLIEKNLVYEIIANAKRYSAESPDIFVNRAERAKEKAINLASSLKTLTVDAGAETEVKLFSGKTGIQRIYNEMIEQKQSKDIYYIGTAKDIVDSLGEAALDFWIKKRIKKGIYTHGIRLREQELDKKLYESSPENLRELFFAPNEFQIKNTIYFYTDVFVLIGKNEGKYFALKLKNKDLVETMMSFYESMKMVSKR